MKWRSSGTHNHLADEDCIIAYQENADLAALGILFDRYVELIFGVCLKYLKDPQDSEDATMEIFEVLREKLRSHVVSSFRSWLYVVARNHCLQILRKHQVRLTEVYEENRMQSDISEHPEDDTLYDLIVENGLHDCLEKLPSAQKRSIELFYFHAKSYQEIADILTLDKEQVRSNLQNGRRNLRNCMDREHGTGGKGQRA